MAANVLFAINMPVSRELTPEWIDLFGLSQYRITFAFITLYILGLFVKDEGGKFTYKEHLILILAGLMGTAANQLSFLAGLSMTSPVDASLIITITPIITMVFAAIIIKEPISLKKSVGVIVGMSGAACYKMDLYVRSNNRPAINMEQTGDKQRFLLSGVVSTSLRSIYGHICSLSFGCFLS